MWKLFTNTIKTARTHLCKFDIHMSVYRECISKITTNKMQRFMIYFFLQTFYIFQAVPPPIIRSKNCTYSFKYCQPLLQLCCYRG